MSVGLEIRAHERGTRVLVPEPVELERPAPPAWIVNGFDGVSGESMEGFPDQEVVVRGSLALVSDRVPGARLLAPESFGEAVSACYARLLATLDRLDRHPVRIWNFVPGILEEFGTLEHRYMAFNAARFVAYEQRYGSACEFPKMLPTASGTGQASEDFVLFCLANTESGIPVENRRQVPAYRYSKRYGPRPPCFARATVLEPGGLDGLLPSSGRVLLAGGTASIRGESSEHVGDLGAQLGETLLNLKALVEAADPAVSAEGPTLDGFRHLRVYHPRLADRAQIAAVVGAEFGRLETLEYAVCDLCRPELLVEIEGVAEVAR